MEYKKSYKKSLEKVIDFITFVNLPIRKKFILFSVGVLSWFIIMCAINIATILYIDSRFGEIVNYVIPHDRITQKIIRKLNDVNINLIEITEKSDIKDVIQIRDLAKNRLLDIKFFLTTLITGGQINDIQRKDNKLIESLKVSPVKEDLKSKKYVNELLPMINTLIEGVDNFAKIKIDTLNKNIGDQNKLKEKIGEYQHLISIASSLSNNYSATIGKLYNINSDRIRSAIIYTSVTITGVLLIAIFLLILFTVWISNAIANPIKSIVGQIRSLEEGEIDLSKKLAIKSKDEIGVLSKEFNSLMESIYNITTFKKIIEEDESLEDVYSRLGKIFVENYGLKEFFIYEVSNSQNKIKPVYPIILSNSEIFCNEDILNNCELCRAKKTGHIISSIDYPNLCKQFRPDIEKEHICIPMIIGGSTGGVVQFLFDKDDIDKDEIYRKILKVEQYLKESLSVIEAKRLMDTLRESALKDALTGLYNRRFLQEYTETLVAGTLRRGKNIGLLMCDLDYFKQVNDLYGHNVGDTVLRETSNIIKRSIRESDLLVRFGGEEFLALLVDINEEEGIKVAEKIRINMEEAKIKIPDGIIKKTISIGVSEFPLDTQSFWQAIKFADVALYKAKELGRNRSVRFTPDMWKEESF
jgi:diguanylate cyclase (GGDEF)-like protein